jgi:hypothetical protein
MHAMETLKYLLIPLRGAALVLIVTFSFLLLIAAHGGLLGLPLALLVVSWFFKYGFVLLDQVADGVNEPPVLSYEMLNPANESRPLGLLFVVAVFYVGTEALRPSLGSDLVTVLRAVGLLLVPAIIMTQAVSGADSRDAGGRMVAGHDVGDLAAGRGAAVIDPDSAA